jgi:hypothetical protein
VNGVGSRLPALLLVGAVLVAAGCTEEGRDAGRPQATSARSGPPPVTRSAAYGISCLQGDERAAAFRFRVGQRFDTVGVILGEGRTGLVFGHERGSNLCEWVPTARAYARLGYRAWSSTSTIRTASTTTWSPPPASCAGAVSPRSC